MYAHVLLFHVHESSRVVPECPMLAGVADDGLELAGLGQLAFDFEGEAAEMRQMAEVRAPGVWVVRNDHHARLMLLCHVAFVCSASAQLARPRLLHPAGRDRDRKTRVKANGL